MNGTTLSRLAFGTDRPLSLIPGAAMAAAVMLLATLGSRYLNEAIRTLFHTSGSPVSTFLVSILLGILLGNTVRFTGFFNAGFKFCTAKLLRLGIILMGIRLSIVAAFQIGAVALAVVVACILCGILVPTILASRFGVGGRLAALISAGTAICGVSAIVAASPVVDATDEETAYAISTITVLGLLATLFYPYMAELVLHLGPGQAGVFLGTAVHDTSQVTGAAYIYDQIWHRSVSNIAITTKLVRNTMIVIVVPLLGVLHARRQPGGMSKVRIRSLFPMFVAGFIALVLFRSAGDMFLARPEGRFLVWSGSSWQAFQGSVKAVSETLLAIAIAAAGLGTRLATLKKLSIKPFLLGLLAMAVVGLVSLVMVRVFAVPIARLVM